MDDLSLFLLDIVENSLNANAKNIEVTLSEDDSKNTITLQVSDNGKGMDQETAEKAVDPFYTTRTTRKVGLGLPFLRQTALTCGGNFNISSERNVGTSVFATFQKNHIDTPPLGNIADTIITILLHPGIHQFIYTHVYNGSTFVFDLEEVKAILDGVSIQDVEIITYIKQYIESNLITLRGGQQ